MEAYEMWKADPERIKVLDICTFEECVLIGHAEMATNIPLAFPTYKWDTNQGNYSVVPNADFVAHVKERFQPDDTILIMCRSGGHSATFRSTGDRTGSGSTGSRSAVTAQA
jgi:hypothetical protein